MDLTLFFVYTGDLEISHRRHEVLIKTLANDTKVSKIIQGPEDRDKMKEARDCLCDRAESRE
jgi:hypothetical protein